MGYIAQTNGGQTVLELREGVLADIAPADMANWRQVQEVWPVVDNVTTVITIPADPVVSQDGSTVTMTWQTQQPPALWNRMRLKDYALQRSMAKADGGMLLPNGVELATSSGQAGLIVDAIEAIERGWAVEPYRIQALNGAWVSLTKDDLLACGQALTRFRLENYASREACEIAIDAGTITSGAQVDAAI